MMIGMPHEPTDECEPVHCYSHHVDEYARDPYLVCGECFHVYRSAQELRRAYQRQSLRIWWAGERKIFSSDWHVGLLLVLRRVITIRTKDIFFCQHCIHDF